MTSAPPGLEEARAPFACGADQVLDRGPHSVWCPAGEPVAAGRSAPRCAPGPGKAADPSAGLMSTGNPDLSHEPSLIPSAAALPTVPSELGAQYMSTSVDARGCAGTPGAAAPVQRERDDGIGNGIRYRDRTSERRLYRGRRGGMRIMRPMHGGRKRPRIRVDILRAASPCGPCGERWLIAGRRAGAGAA